MINRIHKFIVIDKANMSRLQCFKNAESAAFAMWKKKIDRDTAHYLNLLSLKTKQKLFHYKN